MPHPPDRPESRAPLAAEERRTSRASDPLVALARLFEATRRREGSTAIVLADGGGLVIAGAGAAERCADLAACVAAFTPPPPANDTVPCRLDVLGRAARVRRLRIDGVDVLLCAEGQGVRGDDALARAAEGCKRILGQSRGHRPASAGG